MHRLALMGRGLSGFGSRHRLAALNLSRLSAAIVLDGDEEGFDDNGELPSPPIEKADPVEAPVSDDVIDRLGSAVRHCSREGSAATGRGGRRREPSLTMARRSLAHSIQARPVRPSFTYSIIRAPTDHRPKGTDA